VIHTVGPIAQGEPSSSQQTQLADCYKNSLKLALENKLQTVAFPCVSTGVFGYPNEAAAEAVLNTLRNWLEDNKDKIPVRKLRPQSSEVASLQIPLETPDLFQGGKLEENTHPSFPGAVGRNSRIKMAKTIQLCRW
ncbi:PREDICTED: O-acetyl-ADP-ribose deacetylase MACROD1-like, partial [Thamnophis sirtalis]|uniref:O-acetyl-ADP-ribose deacetylase MACROD1-like n=1 Tax=Thamnophis sirtalis TaxID=35019 RepID=A0A6I9Y9I1_9SAUR